MLHTIPNTLLRATVIKRPSASIKSPYVADIELEDGTKALCHTPGQGCSGMVVPGKTIYVCASKKGSKTAYTAQLAEQEDGEGVIRVGIHPMVSQTAARNLLSEISKEAVWASEVKVGDHSRIDYVGTLPTGKVIYVEVKTVMVSFECEKPRVSRRAVFPDGYRKKVTDPMSPRAVKHAEVLTELAQDPGTEQCVFLFVVPRTDCQNGLRMNPADPIYREAVMNAYKGGVLMKGFALDYGLDGTIRLDREIDVYC